MADISKCFKDYDIRGKAPGQLDSAFAQALGTAVAQVLKSARVVIGRDARLSGPELAGALAAGLRTCGVAVTDIGLCGTEELYYAVAMQDFDAGIMVTGSHNPVDENGFKLVRAGAVPIGADSGLREIALLTLEHLEHGQPVMPAQCVYRKSFRSQYIDYLLGHVQKQTRSLRIVADAGNGCAGLVLKELARYLPHDIVPVHFEPDGHFPNGVPNPLLPERRQATAKAVVENRVDFGVAFDGDFDRCFFFDHNGNMVESCYLIGFLAENLLTVCPGQKIVHDARVYWLTREMVGKAGGIPVMSRGGHTRMKETMRRENALYGAEMSAHHFYRDFAFCDSGMLTFLLLLNVLACARADLAELVADGIRRYPCSGEINFVVNDVNAVLKRAWNKFEAKAIHADKMDGINMEFPHWRFNLRGSNTEPLLRLNVESRGNKELLAEKTDELRQLISTI